MTASTHRGGSGEPLVLVHGFLDTWRTWELVLPALERRHDVLVPTLAGHAGGPPLREPPDAEALVDPLEQALDEAGFGTAHVAGNSLGGYLALRLAERGRARSVVAFAPAGGWRLGDPDHEARFVQQRGVYRLAREFEAHADEIASTVEGRRRVTLYTTEQFEHIPADLIAHQIRGVAHCDGAEALLDVGLADEWTLEPERIDCPVRIVWGLADKVLPWPSATVRYREWLPQAEWIELDDVGHCPQLDVPAVTADLILGVSDR